MLTYVIDHLTILCVHLTRLCSIVLRLTDLCAVALLYLSSLCRVKLTDHTGARSILTVVRGSETLPSGLGKAPEKGICRMQDGVVVAEGTGLALPGQCVDWRSVSISSSVRDGQTSAQRPS